MDYGDQLALIIGTSNQLWVIMELASMKSFTRSWPLLLINLK